MLTQFMTDWFSETKRWTDATMKTAAGESAQRKFCRWVAQWRDRAAAALVPVARIALNERTDEVGCRDCPAIQCPPHQGRRTPLRIARCPPYSLRCKRTKTPARSSRRSCRTTRRDQNEAPAMVKIDAEGRLVIRRETIEELIGRAYDLQELQVNLITMSGNLDQTDDEMTLYWNA